MMVQPTSDQLLMLEELVRENFEEDCTGHDFYHTQRVVTLVKKLAQEESADAVICELSAWLHDVPDHKLVASAEIGWERVRAILFKIGLSDYLNVIKPIINEVSYKGASVATPCTSIESSVVQDADRLDAIGAIGIARAFAYGGSKGRKLYDPSVLVELHADFEGYKNSTAPTINHFYEKLLLLKDRLNTPSAKAIALRRHLFMEQFLEQFHEEIKGDM